MGGMTSANQLFSEAKVHVNADAAAIDLARAQVDEAECLRRHTALFHKTGRSPCKKRGQAKPDLPAHVLALQRPGNIGTECEIEAIPLLLPHLARSNKVIAKLDNCNDNECRHGWSEQEIPKARKIPYS
jgi:hypothetical protein